MNLSKAEFENGYAYIYDEFNRKRMQFRCKKLIGYGPKGIVVESISGIIDVISLDCRYRHLPKFQFAKEQFALHDDYLQVRC